MTRRSRRASSAGVGGGWEALRRGRWREARVAFERAVSARETAEALEGLSWAAWWLDDADALFDARERAYQRYRRAGDRAAAARMATWLAADQLDFRGAAAVASGWLGRARRLLEGCEPGPDHGWLAFHEGYIAHGAGDTAAARERASFAADIGRRSRVADLEMLGLALEGAALVAAAEVEDGMRRLDEAAAVALEGDATIPISSAWVCCFLVTACTAVRDYERAFEWCDRISAFAERYESRYMLAFCRAEYGSVLLLRGRWAEAERMLAAAHDDFARSRPPYADGPRVALAELRRRQGRIEEAFRILESTGPGRAREIVRGRLLLDLGDARQAIDLLERLLRRIPEHRAFHRVSVLEPLVRAQIAGGDLDAAGQALGALRAIEERLGTGPLRAGSDLLDGMLLAARGEPDAARKRLEDAVDRFHEAGTPFEAAEARIALAGALHAIGRPDAAATEARTARSELGALGALAEAQRAERLLAGGDAAPPLPGITARERQVLRLLADGLTNRQIAARLRVSEHTVHRHVTSILRKLALPSRAAAAAHAVRAGLVESDGP